MRVKSLSSLRFLFFISIFLSHYIWNGEFLFPMGGPMGVSFFFILSGFSLSMGYGSKIQSIDMKEFLKKRLIKVYPMHLITLGFRVITFLIIPLVLGECVTKKIISLVLNVFLLQAWVPDAEIIFSYNTIAWFLSPIVFFYVVFPVLYKLIEKVKLRHFIPIIIILYVLAVSFVPEGLYQEFIYVAPLFRVVDFIIGIVSYKLLKRLLNNGIGVSLFKRNIRVAPYVIEALVVLIVILTIIIHGLCDVRLGMAALFWLPMAAIIILLSLSETQVGGVFYQIRYWKN